VRGELTIETAANRAALVVRAADIDEQERRVAGGDERERGGARKKRGGGLGRGESGVPWDLFSHAECEFRS
jgi:hypothetical protein